MCRKVSRGEHLPLGVAVSSSEAPRLSSRPDLVQQRMVNPVWRAKVTQWCYDYVDCIQERRSLVFIAMNLLDRYVQCTEMDHTKYQVAALSCTHLAIRIAGSKDCQNLDELVAMSRGTISTREIVQIGTDIVERLSWDERMETPFEHIHGYMQVLEDTSTTRLDAAYFMTEVAVFCPTLMMETPRWIAAAALLRVLPSTSIPRFVQLLDKDEIKRVYEISHRLGDFVKECLGNAVKDDNEEEEPHTIHMIEDEGFLPKVSPAVSPVMIDGAALIPFDDDDMDEN